MRAGRITAWGKTPEVVDIPGPSRQEGYTIVAIEAAVVSHLDLTIASGNFDLSPELPYTGGVEGCGRVITSSRHEPGTQVLVRGGGVGLVKDGCWADEVIVRDKAVHDLGPDVPPEVLTSFFQPCSTAHVAVHDIGKFVDGERILVRGAAGAVGSMVVAIALRAGIEVVASVGRSEQATRVRDGVADVVIESESELSGMEATFDGIVDTVGGPDAGPALSVVRQGGRAVLVGYTAGPEVKLELSNWLLQEVTLLPVNMIRREDRAKELALHYMPLIASGELTMSTTTYPLDDLAVAIEDLKHQRVSGRAVVTTAQ